MLVRDARYKKNECCPILPTQATQPSQCRGTGGAEALRNAVGGVPALARTQGQPPQVPQCAAVSEAPGQRCTVRDMTREVRAEPQDHGTGSAGLETGEACQRTSHSPQPRGGGLKRGGSTFNGGINGRC